MLRMVRSECLKLKGSYQLYLLLAFSLLLYISLPAYLFTTKASYALDMAIYLPLLAESLLASLLSILAVDQEVTANHFQQIRSARQKGAIWLAKLLVINALFLLPTIGLWGVLGLFKQSFLPCLWIGLLSWLTVSFLAHFHLLLALLVRKGSNLLVAFVECLCLLFASNQVFLGISWLPVVLPINVLISGNAVYLLSFLAWFVLVTGLGVALICKGCYRTGEV